MEARLRTGRILPFSLRQEPVRLAGLFRQPGRISVSILPIDASHRVVIALLETRIPPSRPFHMFPVTVFEEKT